MHVIFSIDVYIYTYTHLCHKNVINLLYNFCNCYNSILKLTTRARKVHTSCTYMYVLSQFKYIYFQKINNLKKVEIRG